MDRRLVVLIVEDDPDVLASLAIFVEGFLGADVLSANGFLKSAQAINEAEHIDLLLCDVTLPGEMNGIDIADLAVATHPKIAVVMMSADPFNEIEGLIESYSFLQKPFGLDEVTRHIDMAFVGLRGRYRPDQSSA